MQNLANMDKAALEALVLRTLGDAVGGAQRIAAYLAVCRGEPVSRVAARHHVCRKTLYRWVRGVERYLATLRSERLLPEV